MVVLVNIVNTLVVVVMPVVFIIIVHFLINITRVISERLVNENFTNLRIVVGVHLLILIVYGHYLLNARKRNILKVTPLLHPWLMLYDQAISRC